MATLNSLNTAGKGNIRFHKNTFKTAYISKAIKLIIESYAQIVNDHALIGECPKEPTRRNCLIHYMNRNNENSKIFLSINAESETYDEETFESLGRIDIKLAISYNCDYYYSFECKRFLKSTLGSAKIKKDYIDDGVQRYIDLKYSPKMNEAGMIAFVETGNINKAAVRIKEVIQSISQKGTSTEDLSDKYLHKHVYLSTHKRVNDTNINISHVILDFTSK
jgi:hypothetical protein